MKRFIAMICVITLLCSGLTVSAEDLNTITDLTIEDVTTAEDSTTESSNISVSGNVIEETSPEQQPAENTETTAPADKVEVDASTEQDSETEIVESESDENTEQESEQDSEIKVEESEQNSDIEVEDSETENEESGSSTGQNSIDSIEDETADTSAEGTEADSPTEAALPTESVTELETVSGNIMGEPIEEEYGIEPFSAMPENPMVYRVYKSGNNLYIKATNTSRLVCGQHTINLEFIPENLTTYNTASLTIPTLAAGKTYSTSNAFTSLWNMPYRYWNVLLTDSFGYKSVYTIPVRTSDSDDNSIVLGLHRYTADQIEVQYANHSKLTKDYKFSLDYDSSMGQIFDSSGTLVQSGDILDYGTIDSGKILRTYFTFKPNWDAYGDFVITAQPIPEGSSARLPIQLVGDKHIEVTFDDRETELAIWLHNGGDKRLYDCDYYLEYDSDVVYINMPNNLLHADIIAPNGDVGGVYTYRWKDPTVWSTEVKLTDKDGNVLGSIIIGQGISVIYSIINNSGKRVEYSKNGLLVGDSTPTFSDVCKDRDLIDENGNPKYTGYKFICWDKDFNTTVSADDVRDGTIRYTAYYYKEGDFTVACIPDKKIYQVGDIIKFIITLGNDTGTATDCNTTMQLNKSLEFSKTSYSDGGIYDKSTHSVLFSNTTIPAFGSKELYVYCRATEPIHSLQVSVKTSSTLYDISCMSEPVNVEKPVGTIESLGVVYDLGYKDAPKYKVSGLKDGDQTPYYIDSNPSKEHIDSSGDPVRTGYTFVGWAPAIMNFVDKNVADENGNITYLAVWDKIPIPKYWYTVRKEYYATNDTLLDDVEYDKEGELNSKITYNAPDEESRNIGGTDYDFYLDDIINEDGIVTANEDDNIVTIIYREKTEAIQSYHYSIDYVYKDLSAQTIDTISEVEQAEVGDVIPFEEDRIIHEERLYSYDSTDAKSVVVTENNEDNHVTVTYLRNVPANKLAYLVRYHYLNSAGDEVKLDMEYANADKNTLIPVSKSDRFYSNLLFKFQRAEGDGKVVTDKESDNIVDVYLATAEKEVPVQYKVVYVYTDADSNVLSTEEFGSALVGEDIKYDANRTFYDGKLYKFDKIDGALKVTKKVSNNVLYVYFKQDKVPVVTPDEPVTPDMPDEPNEPDKPNKPDKPNRPDKPDKPDKPNSPSVSGNSPSEPETPSKQPKPTAITEERKNLVSMPDEGVPLASPTPQTGDNFGGIVANTVISGLAAIIALFIALSNRRKKS